MSVRSAAAASSCSLLGIIDGTGGLSLVFGVAANAPPKQQQELVAPQPQPPSHGLCSCSLEKVLPLIREEDRVVRRMRGGRQGEGEEVDEKRRMKICMDIL